MYRFLRSYSVSRILSPLLAMVWIVWMGGASAAFNRELDYFLSYESNTELDDRHFSDLRLRLNDTFSTSEYLIRYDLNSRFLKNHDDAESNGQHNGDLTGQYYFVVPSLRWNLDASVDVLPSDTGVEIDEFDSQTLTRIATGPGISFRPGTRGFVDLRIESLVVDYSEANLDSETNGATIVYRHPISELTTAALELAYVESRYDDDINSANDFDLETIGLRYFSSTRFVDYRLGVATNTVDGLGNTENETTHEFGIDYKVNAASTLSLRYLNTLQTAETLNLLPGNLEESRFKAGIFRNERAELSYAYSKRDLFSGIRVFSNQLETVVSTVNEDDNFDGWGTWYENRISERLKVELVYDHTIAKPENFEEDDIELSLLYTLDHTSRVSSIVVLFLETEKMEDEKLENAGLFYRVKLNLFH